MRATTGRGGEGSSFNDDDIDDDTGGDDYKLYESTISTISTLTVPSSRCC